MNVSVQVGSTVGAPFTVVSTVKVGSTVIGTIPSIWNFAFCCQRFSKNQKKCSEKVHILDLNLKWNQKINKQFLFNIDSIREIMLQIIEHINDRGRFERTRRMKRLLGLSNIWAVVRFEWSAILDVVSSGMQYIFLGWRDIKNELASGCSNGEPDLTYEHQLGNIRIRMETSDKPWKRIELMI